MLDIKQIRENPEQVQAKLNLRGGGYDLEPILALDRQQRELEVGRRNRPTYKGPDMFLVKGVDGTKRRK
ncbi:MAG: hypothetical protein SNJ81_09290, partial [Cyanobacteriota bacterium]